MLTDSEKSSLALTLAFLLAGGGIKFWKRSQAELGPFATPAADIRAEKETRQGGDPRADSAEAAAPPTGAPGDAASALRLAGDSAGGLVVAGSGSSADPRAAERTRRAAQKARPAGKVDINRASAAELAAVPGIGPKTAQAIVALRQSKGPFPDLKALLQVKGIGEKKLARMAPYLISPPQGEETEIRRSGAPGEAGVDTGSGEPR